MPGIGQWLRRARPWCGLFLLLVAFDASALRPLAPGQPVTLEAGEGLLAVAFDTDAPVASAQFESADRSFTRGTLRELPQGRTVALYAVPAGRYRWGRITVFSNALFSYVYDLGKSPEYSFEVKAGTLAYAGDLVLRSRTRAAARLADRALPVMDWLQERYPDALSRYGFEYSGMFPDPFPAFYRDLLAAGAKLPADPDAGRVPPDPGALPLAPALVWSTSGIRDYALSPDGSLLAIEVATARSGSALELIDLANGKSQRVFVADRGLGTVAWESARILVAGLPANNQEYLRVVHVGEFRNGQREVRWDYGPLGRIVDMTPDQPGQVLFERFDSFDKLVVHPLRLDDKRSLDAVTRLPYNQRLNRGVDGDRAWFTDGHGALRAVLARRGDDAVLLYGRDREFREVLKFDTEDAFDPMMLSYEGDLIYGLSDQGRQQRDFVAFDPGSGTIVKTLFSQPGIDVVSPLFDDRRNPVGVTYYEAGRLISRYFDAAQQARSERLQKAFPGRTAVEVQRSTDGSRLLAWVDGSDAPPQLYLIDLKTNKADIVDDYYPGLSGKTFAPTEALKVRAPDGTPIDAFLTLPAGNGKRALVVMPHGGPIGIADRRHFDPDVQFLASLGYAVLQVNFRGSEGYGKAFREAGRGQYGTGIENDIDAAIREALARYPLDAGRVCIVGASYGGYSALISAIRWPDRFRCAVSMSGVSDRLLAFSATDGAATQAGRRMLVEQMGDPRPDPARFIAVSPLYQYKRLTLPVMLVHGTEDARVDYEQTRRLVRVLGMDGRPPVLMTLNDIGHSLGGPDTQARVWSAVAGFLREHLGGAPIPAKPSDAKPSDAKAPGPTSTGSASAGG